jgi:transposase
MSKIITVGLDLAKNVFQVHGVDDAGRAVLRKKLRMMNRFWGSDGSSPVSSSKP